MDGWSTGAGVGVGVGWGGAGRGGVHGVGCMGCGGEGRGTCITVTQKPAFPLSCLS